MSCNKTSCYGKQLFVSVSGNQHSSAQKFQFYDKTDQVQQNYIEAKQQLREKPGYSIFSWEWTPETEQRNIWLSIESEIGGEIKVPLFPVNTKGEDDFVFKEGDFTQLYHIQAVVPLTLLPSFQNTQYPEQNAAPIRNGYIYLFRDNKLWREIKAESIEGQGMEFRDTHLYAHRGGQDKPFKKGKRDAVGKPLKEIWLPAKTQQGNLSVYAAYSEVQWSASYINFLEQPDNREILQQRVQLIHPSVVKGLGQKLKNQTFGEMRLREPEIEVSLAEPARYVNDLTGQYLTQTYGSMEYEVRCLKESQSNLITTLENGTHLRHEYALRNTQYQAQAGKDVADLWQARASVDYLADARERQLDIIVLSDPLFDLRHHSALATEVTACLLAVLEDASKQEHFNSAELVQRFVVPARLPNGQDNPNHEHLGCIDLRPGGVFNRTLRSIERRRCQQDMALFQAKLGTLINRSDTAAVIRDITSLDRGASGAYKVVGDAFNALSINLAAIDPLHDKEQPEKWPGRDTLASFYTQGASHPLHPLLYPSADQVPLDKEYIAPEPVNDGSGLATPENISRWSGENLLLADDPEMLEQAMITELGKNDTDGFSVSRKLLNTVDGVIGSFYASMMALQKKKAARAQLSEMLETVEFKAAYLDNIRLAKLVDPDNLGQMTFKPTSGEGIAGAYVLGVHSKKARLHFGLTEDQRSHVHSKRYGILQDKNGRLVAATYQRSLKGTELRKGATVARKADLRVLTVPENTSLELLKEADLKEQVKAQTKGESIAGKVYQGLGVPYFIVVLEVVNLQRTVAGYNDRHSTGYRLVSGFSAIFDLGVALLNASNFLNREVGRIATFTTTKVVKIPQGVVRFLSRPALNLQFTATLSRLQVAGAFGGVLTTAVAIWDTSLLIAAQDNDAAMAMSMVALGTGLSTFGGLYTTTFLLSPLGWIGLVIALVGFGLYMLFKDSPMETWLKNGPFGHQPDTKGDYKSLQQPKTAWNHLLSLISNIQINTYPLAEIEIDPTQKARLAQQGGTHGVWVTSNLPGLNCAEFRKLRFYAREAIKKTTSTHNRTTAYSGPEKTTTLEQISKRNSIPLQILDTDNGTLYFYSFSSRVPGRSSNGPFKTFLTGDAESYSYSAHFHCRAQYQVGEHHLPAPPLSKLEQAGEPGDDPTFTNKDYWWAAEAVRSGL